MDCWSEEDGSDDSTGMEGEDDVDEGAGHLASARRAGLGHVLYVEPRDVYLLDGESVKLVQLENTESLPLARSRREHNKEHGTDEETARLRRTSNLLLGVRGEHSATLCPSEIRSPAWLLRE